MSGLAGDFWAVLSGFCGSEAVRADFAWQHLWRLAGTCTDGVVCSEQARADVIGGLAVGFLGCWSGFLGFGCHFVGLRFEADLAVWIGFCL